MFNAAVITKSDKERYKLEVYFSSQLGVSHILYHKDPLWLSEQLVNIIKEENTQ